MSRQANVGFIPTPAVMAAVVRRNVDRFPAHAHSRGLAVRPHITTHKLPDIARLQLDAGAIGITCQNLSEAEAMVERCPAIHDILLTCNIVGKDKLARLAALARRVRLAVAARGCIV